MAGGHVFAYPEQRRADVRYYGYYSNVSRGEHKKEGIDDAAADLQLQTHADTIYGDPEYTWDEYVQS